MKHPRRLARWLVSFADQAEPLRKDAFDVLTNGLGVSVEDTAIAARVDLETAIRADEWALAKTPR